MYTQVRHPLGFIQVSPMPTPEQLNEHYASKYYQQPEGSYQDQYNQEELDWALNKARLAEKTATKFAKLPDSSFLDIGCGEGFFMDYFHKQGYVVEGWDFSSHGISKFHPHLLPYFKQGDIYDLIDAAAAAGTSFSCINLSNVLEHVIDPIKLLQEIKKVLKPGGVLRVCVPNDFSEFQKLLVARGNRDLYWWAPPEHLSYFDKDSLQNVIQHCGYKSLTILANFPVESFVMHKLANFWEDDSRGKSAHRARVTIENFLLTRDMDDYIAYAAAAGKLGYGRELTAYIALA